MNIELRTNASKLEQDTDIIAWACKTYHEANKYNHSDYDVKVDNLKKRITVRSAGRDPQPSDKAISYLKQHFVYNYDEIRDRCQGTIKYYEFTPRYADNS